MVAADSVSDCGWRYELANYGEYCGAPGTEGTYTCAKIMFSLTTRHRHPDGKFLIAGGAIAQFYRCCSHVCHCDQSSGRFYVGVQGVHGQNLDSTSWSKLPRQDCVGLRQLGQRSRFADGSVRPRDSHHCCGAHGVGIAARVY